MELRHLRYFVAVAEEEHITRAAERLGIQQPPLSQQIRDLERELNVSLFERTARSIRLNPAGRIFLEDARALLALANAAVLRAQQADRGELGRISVGYTSSASLHEDVPRVIQQFRSCYPQVRLEVHENTTRDLLDAVAARAVDVAFVRSWPSRYPGLCALTLTEEAMSVALPTHHPLARETRPIALGALADEPFIMYRRAEGPGIWDDLLAACRRAGFVPRAVEEVPRLLSAVTMVAAGLGISILPRSAQSLHRGSVVFRPLDDASTFHVPLNLVYPAELDLLPVARFVDIAKESLAVRPAGKR
ncbi:LysR family transcriptional regulator [Burkholderia sp. D-99]|nr:LysR family transcriptional regulator [Burkholderia sp. D-99]